VGTIKVNLYLISTGPYHQNFAILQKNGENSRIYFDFKISQIIEIELNSIKAEIDPFTKHPGEKFNYSIKTIVIPPSLRLATTPPSMSAHPATPSKSTSTAANTKTATKSSKAHALHWFSGARAA
jgi:hypothetical protein